jgi:hypothetical protein
MPKAYIGKQTASSTNVVGKTGYPACRRLKLEPYISPSIENQFKIDQRS